MGRLKKEEHIKFKRDKHGGVIEVIRSGDVGKEKGLADPVWKKVKKIEKEQKQKKKAVRQKKWKKIKKKAQNVSRRMENVNRKISSDFGVDYAEKKKPSARKKSKRKSQSKSQYAIVGGKAYPVAGYKKKRKKKGKKTTKKARGKTRERSSIDNITDQFFK